MNRDMSERTTARTLKEMEEIAQFLFELLDDMDTLDDAAKGDDGAFRRQAYLVQQRRWEVASTDGYKVWWTPGESPEPPPSPMPEIPPSVSRGG
jgi:hypothetical protein